MLRRRLTALLASLLLLPSTLGGGQGCDTGGLAPESHSEHGAHHADAGAVLEDADEDSPSEAPDAPAECILAAGCGTAAVAAVTTSIEHPAHVVGSVHADAALAPDSPAPGLEPPPPRA